MPKQANSNEPDAEVTRRAVKEIEEHYIELLTERGSYMQRCRSIRDRIKGVYESAAESGVPRKELRGVIKQRALLRRADAVPEQFEPDQRELFELLKSQLGDFGQTPLGQAALARAQAETLDSLTH
jgi:hypothetical protein